MVFGSLSMPLNAFHHVCDPVPTERLLMPSAATSRSRCDSSIGGNFSRH
jgi:hypothetical protein